jgi:hypothetical protein
MRILVIEDEVLIVDFPIDRVADAARTGRQPRPRSWVPIAPVVCGGS